MRNYIIAVLIILTMVLSGCAGLTVVPGLSEFTGAESTTLQLKHYTGDGSTTGCSILTSQNNAIYHPGGPTCTNAIMPNIVAFSKFTIDGVNTDSLTRDKTLYYTSGKQVGYIQLKGRLTGKGYNYGFTSSGIYCPTTFWAPRYNIKVECIDGGNVRSIYSTDYKLLQGQDYIDFEKSIDINNNPCGIFKVTYTIGDMACHQAINNNYNVQLDLTVTYVPFTYKQSIETKTLDTPRTQNCPSKYLYCTYETTDCKQLKDVTLSRSYPCTDGSCVGVYFTSDKTYDCEVPIEGNTPVLRLYGHSYTQLCSNEVCIIGTKQCSGSQPQICSDSNNDGCGDSWTNNGNLCSGNYDCTNGVCACKSSIKCDGIHNNGEQWCSNNNLYTCTVNQAACTATSSSTACGAKTCTQSGTTASCQCNVNSCTNPVANLNANACVNNDVKTCTLNTATCSASYVPSQDCTAEQNCAFKDNIYQCVCADNHQVGDKEYYSTAQYYEWINTGATCPVKTLKTCEIGRYFDVATNKCECSTTNQCYDINKVTCEGDNARKICKEVSGSFSSEQGTSCYAWQGYTESWGSSLNKYPASQVCVGDSYVCKSESCSSGYKCSDDKLKRVPCVASPDNNPNCKVWSDASAVACSIDYLCQNAECVPKYPCDPNDAVNGMYKRCSPMDSTKVQKCVYENLKYLWKDDVSCDASQVCTTGSDAYCAAMYVVDITTKPEYSLGSSIDGITVAVTQGMKKLPNTELQVCLEKSPNKCSGSDAQNLYPVTNDPTGVTSGLSFNSPLTSGTYYITAFVIDPINPENSIVLRDATVKSKPIDLKKRLSLNIAFPGTAYVGATVSGVITVTEVDASGKVLQNLPVSSLSTVKITYNNQQLTASYSTSGTKTLSFSAPSSTGIVVYNATMSIAGYTTAISSGTVNIVNPTLQPAFLIDGVPYDSVTDHFFDTGKHEITISVLEGSNYLELNFDNLRIIPPNGVEEALTLSDTFNNKIYKTTYDFGEAQKSYTFSGYYTAKKSNGQVVQMQELTGKIINTKQGIGGGEDIWSNYTLWAGIGLGFIAMIVVFVLLIKKKR